MVLSLDQSTVANMTAALEYICKQIPPKSDSHKTRKAIADAMLAGAKAGARSLPQLQEIGSTKLKKNRQPQPTGNLRRIGEAHARDLNNFFANFLRQRGHRDPSRRSRAKPAFS
jgi:hypothetical protein